MMAKIKLLTAAVVTACALFSGVAFANSDGDDDAKAKSFMEKMDARQKELYKELNLTDDQKNALEENKNKNRAEKKALFERMRANKDLMRQELQKEQLYMQKINALNTELKELQAGMVDGRLQGILEVRKILTPEQFNKFLTNNDDRKGRWNYKGGARKEGVESSVPDLPAEDK